MLTAIAYTWSATSGLPSRTVRKYDGAGREILSTEYKGDAPQWSTRTIHAGDRVTVIPPTGGVTTTKVSDARGQFVQQQRWTAPPTWDGNAPVGGTYQATKYAYDTVGNQTGIEAPGGATWATSYDLAGRVTHKNDPDLGDTDLTYNDLGELTSTTDARGLTLAYDYDKLGRKVAERVGTTVLANWAYDKADVGGVEVNEPGALISSTRHRGTEDYTVATTGFNPVGRPLGTRIELDEDGFKTAYTTSQSWTSTGLVKEEYLADSRNGTAGGVAGEKITHDYDTFGNPISTTGINGYVTETLMSPYGEVNRYTLGANNLTAWISYQRDEMTRRTSEVMLSASISPPQVERPPIPMTLLETSPRQATLKVAAPRRRCRPSATSTRPSIS